MTARGVTDRKAIQKWVRQYTLSVPRHVIERAVRNLGPLESLALIRGAFGASLPDARLILMAIKAGGGA